MAELIKDIFAAVSLVIDAAAGLIIVIASIYAIVQYLSNFLESLKTPAKMDGVRIRLGKSLSLSLEFLIGADILKTVASPTLRDISILAATIGIRVVLNFFLDRDVAHLMRESQNPKA